MPNPSVAWYTKSPHAYNAKHRQMHTRSRCRAVLFNSVLPHLVGCDSPRLKQANGAACDRFRVILRGVDDLWKCLWGALDHMMIPCEMPRYKDHVAWTLLAISLTSWTCPNSVPSFFLWGQLVESHSYMICIYIYIESRFCRVKSKQMLLVKSRFWLVILRSPISSILSNVFVAIYIILSHCISTILPALLSVVNQMINHPQLWFIIWFIIPH